MGHGSPAISPSIFAELWMQAYPRVRAYVRTLIRSSYDEDDVMQETAIALAKDFSKYDPERPFAEWAIGYAHYRVLKHFEKTKSDRMTLVDSESVDRLRKNLSIDDDELDARREALRACLGKLPSASQRLIDLRYNVSLKAEQIAEQEGYTVASVYSRLSQIRVTLRECVVRRIGAQER